MVKKVLIKLKRKPKFPEKHVSVARNLDCDGLSVQEIIEWLDLYDLDPDNVHIESVSHQGYYGEHYTDSCIKTKTPETNEEHNYRVAAYEKSLKKYNAWYEKNKDLIVKETARREKEEIQKAKVAKIRAEKAKVSKKTKLEKQIKKLTKELKTIKG